MLFVVFLSLAMRMPLTDLDCHRRLNYSSFVTNFQSNSHLFNFYNRNSIVQYYAIDVIVIRA
jgi:hypothetical protein